MQQIQNKILSSEKCSFSVIN